MNHPARWVLGFTFACGISAAQPSSQTIIFEGSVQNEHTFYVAHTASGLLATHEGEPPDCFEEFLAFLDSVEGSAAYQISSPLPFVYFRDADSLLATALDAGFIVIQPGLIAPTLELSALENDCDLVNNYDAAQTTLDEIRAEAVSVLATIQDKESQVNAFLDRILAVLQNLPPAEECFDGDTQPPIDSYRASLELLHCFNLYDDVIDVGDPSTYFFDCENCLDSLRAREEALKELQELDFQVQSFELVLDEINRLLQIGAIFDLKQKGQRECISLILSDASEYANSALEQARGLIDFLFTEPCTLEAALFSCDICPDGDDDSVDTGPVISVPGGQTLAQLPGAFTASAHLTDDADFAIRALDLADRIKGIDANRILHVTAPGTAPFAQRFVALPPADRPDDGESPLAVVLTTRAFSMETEPWTVNDAVQLRAAFAEMASMIAPTAPKRLTDESEFSAEAIRVTFDPDEGRADGEVISDQYTGQGLSFVDDALRTPTVFSTESSKIVTHSPPHALFNLPDSATDVPLVLQFESPVRRVGIYYGAGDLGGAANMTAFDEFGGLIFRIDQRGIPLDVTQFFAIDGGVSRIAIVELEYISDFSEVIDSLIFDP